MSHSLEHSGVLLEALLGQTSDAYFLVDSEGQIVDANGRACESLGYTRDELIRKRVWDIETTLTQTNYRQHVEGKTADEVICTPGVHRRKNGSEFPVDVRVALRKLGSEWCCMVLARDVADTVRRQAEEDALRKLRLKVWDMKTSRDLRNVVTYVGESLSELKVPFDQCGVNIVEVDGDSQITHCHNMSRDGKWSAVSERGLSIPTIWGGRKTRYRPDLLASDFYKEHSPLQAEFDHEVRSVLDVPFSHGTLAASSAEPQAFSESDVTLLERMAEVLSAGFRRWEDIKALAEEQDRIHHIFEEGPIGMAIVSLDLTYRRVNPAFCRMLGYSESEMVGKPVTDFHHPEDHGIDSKVAAQTLNGMRPYFTVEKRYLHKNGGTVFGSLTGAVVRSKDGQPQHWVSMIEDVTQRRLAEREMGHLERLRALGEMARGVAHNFNNILVGVLGYAQIIQMKSIDPDIVDDVQSIVDSALRAKELVQRLNRVVRDDGEQTLHPVDVAKVIDDAVAQALPRWKDEARAKGIQIKVETQVDDIPEIRGTETHLHDIISNLLFNAIDALPGGGLIRVEADVSGEWVQIRVRDNGVGMDGPTRARLFDPFFTTKALVGTGLGLSTVHATVQRWNGTIAVDSSIGKGSTFTVRLPIWKETGQGPDPMVAGGILLVEDEDLVVRVLTGLLSNEYSLASAEDGEAALSKFGRQTFDVAVIDLGLPDMPGDQLAIRLRNLDASVVTVLITGWELQDDDPRLAAFDFYLQKPFEDVGRVRETLENALKLRARRISTARSKGVA